MITAKITITESTHARQVAQFHIQTISQLCYKEPFSSKRTVPLHIKGIPVALQPTVTRTTTTATGFSHI